MSPIPLGILASALSLPQDPIGFASSRPSVKSELRADDQTNMSTLIDRAGISWTPSGGTAGLSAAATPTGKSAMTFSANASYFPSATGLMKGVLELAEVTALSTFQNQPSYAPLNIMGKQGDYASSGAAMPQWIKMRLTTPKVVTEYKIASGQGARSPKDWIFQGSNDGDNWVNLDTRTNQPSQGLTTFSFSNSTSYLWYRYYVTAINGGDLLYLTGLYMTGVDLRGTDLQQVEHWVVLKGTAVNSGHPLLFSSVGDTRYKYQDNQIYTGYGTNGRYSYVPTLEVINNWRIYRLQRDGSVAREYLDNVLQLTATAADTFLSTPYIGRGGNYLFSGQIAYSVILAEKLSSSDASDFYNSLRSFFITG